MKLNHFFVSLAAILGLCSLPSVSEAQFYVYKNGVAVFSMAGEQPDYIEFVAPETTLEQYLHETQSFSFRTTDSQVKAVLAQWFKEFGQFGPFRYTNGLIYTVEPIPTGYVEGELGNLGKFIGENILTTAAQAELAQSIRELENLMPDYKAAYEADLADFNKAVADYQKAALDFKWSSEAKRSLVYDKMREAVQTAREAMDEAREQLYYAKDEKTENAARSAFCETVRSFCKLLREYYPLRYAFDGFESPLCAYYNVVDRNSEGYDYKVTRIIELKNLPENPSDIECEAIFNTIMWSWGGNYSYDIYYANGSYRTVYQTVSMENLIGYDAPNDYNEKVGFGHYVYSAKKLMGPVCVTSFEVDGEGRIRNSTELMYPRQIELTDEEVAALYKDGDYLKKCGSQGLYHYTRIYLDELKARLGAQPSWAALLKSVQDANKAVSDKIEELIISGL